MTKKEKRVEGKKREREPKRRTPNDSRRGGRESIRLKGESRE